MLCSPQPKILDLTPAKYYLRGVIGRYPHARTIHLVMDNSHTRKALVDRFDETEGGRLWNRPTVHYTPKHGSWLKQAEIAINLFSPSALGGGASQIKPVAAAKPAPGIVASIATTSPFSGILLAVSLAKGRLLNFTVTVLVTGI